MRNNTLRRNTLSPLIACVTISAGLVGATAATAQQPAPDPYANETAESCAQQSDAVRQAACLTAVRQRELRQAQRDLEAAQDAQREAELANARQALVREQESIDAANRARALLASRGEAVPALPEQTAPASAQGNGKGNGNDPFAGFGFGAGIAYVVDIGDDDRVGEVELVDGVVRVLSDDNASARFIAETHYFFTPCGAPFFIEVLGVSNDCLPRDSFNRRRLAGPAEWGFGPFIAIQPDSDRVIDAIGAGIMFGLRRGRTTNDSFNIGIGLLVDIDTRILGEGIRANEMLPGNETEIRFQETDQVGVVVLTSYSF